MECGCEAALLQRDAPCGARALGERERRRGELHDDLGVKAAVGARRAFACADEDPHRGCDDEDGQGGERARHP
jgi:hypothetical protein